MENILTIVKNILIYLKDKIFYYLSLCDPKSRLTVIFVATLTLIILPIEKLYLLPTFSVYRKIGLYDYFGFEFYSSGFTRALSSFFHLEFEKAYEFNPLVFPFIIVLSIIIIKDIYLIIKSKKINLSK